MNSPHARRGVHEPNVLHTWVFLQDRVWIDRYGWEHEIDSMEPDYVRNVLAFCEGQAARIATLVMFDLAELSLDATARDDIEALDRWAPMLGDDDLSPDEFLAATPLMAALGPVQLRLAVPLAPPVPHLSCRRDSSRGDDLHRRRQWQGVIARRSASSA